MSNLRLLDPNFSDNFEGALRRFFSPTVFDAETRSEKETRNGDKVLRSERHYGAISRSFSLGQDVDGAKVQAKYADGVLSLELPKAAQAASRRIAIQ